MKKENILLILLMLGGFALSAQTKPDGTPYDVDDKKEKIYIDDGSHLVKSKGFNSEINYSSGSSDISTGSSGSRSNRGGAITPVSGRSIPPSVSVIPVPGAPPGGFPTPATPAIPVDGGVGFLIVAGMGYGLKRMRKK